jgi:AraC-like DNA-binding protein
MRQPRRGQIHSLSYDYAAGHVVEPHCHDWHQLLYASRGVMTLGVAVGSFVVPPHRGAWIPAGVEHGIRMSGRVQMRTLYLRPSLSPRLPGDCRVLSVTPLLRELILRAVELETLDRRRARERHLVDLVLDELRTLPSTPLSLPELSDERARRVARALEAHPGDGRPLARLARAAGASGRTIERIFERETGMTFASYRQQLRMLHALRLLADGAAVTRVALDVGYESPSAFVHAFRRLLGTTPGRYFHAEHDRGAAAVARR